MPKLSGLVLHEPVAERPPPPPNRSEQSLVSLRPFCSSRGGILRILTFYKEESSRFPSVALQP